MDEMSANEYKLEVRIPRDLEQTLRDAAAKEERTLPQQVRLILKRWLGDQPTQKAA
jgi:hypothetical protein